MRKTLVLGAVAALSLAAAPTAIAKPLSNRAARSATVTRATKDARKSGTVLGVSVKACRRSSSHRQVCKVTTRVGQAAGERTCQVRYRVTLKGRKARARRVGSAKCSTADGSSVAPPGSVSHPATPPQPGDAPPAQGEAHDPFNDCWAGCA